MWPSDTIDRNTPVRLSCPRNLGDSWRRSVRILHPAHSGRARSSTSATSQVTSPAIPQPAAKALRYRPGRGAFRLSVQSRQASSTTMPSGFSSRYRGEADPAAVVHFALLFKSTKPWRRLPCTLSQESRLHPTLTAPRPQSANLDCSADHFNLGNGSGPRPINSPRPGAPCCRPISASLAVTRSCLR